MSSVAPSPGEGMSRVPSTLGEGLSNVSATTGTRRPGSRSRVDAVDGSSSPTVGSAASNSIGSPAGPSGGMRSVSSARGSRASLIGRLHFGSGLAPDDDVGTNITYPIRGDSIQEKTCRSSAGRRTFEQGDQPRQGDAQGVSFLDHRRGPIAHRAMRLRVTPDLEGARGEPLGVEEAGEPPRLAVVDRLADRIGVGRPTMANSAIVRARSSGCGAWSDRPGLPD